MGGTVWDMTNRHLIRPWDATQWTMLGPCATPPRMKRGDWYEITDGNITVKVQRSELERSYTARRGLIGGYGIPEGAQLRTYKIEYRLVASVAAPDPSDQSYWCDQTGCSGVTIPRDGFGGTNGHGPAMMTCTVYGHDMDGNPLETECCDGCVLNVIDREHDTDSSRLVVVERSVTQ